MKKKEEINNLSREDVNRFDRPATYNYSESIAGVSDLVVGLCLVLPATFFTSGKTQKDVSIIGAMYLEMLLLSGSLPLRVQAGKHFPTDVLVGAAVGSAIGYFIPYFHRQKSNNHQLSIVADTFSRQVLIGLKLSI
jgi:hypothetical protein